jgi:hypothetical protein
MLKIRKDLHIKCLIWIFWVQDIMKNPHVAADGFSYDLEAIAEWLEMGRDTSPMTNLRLKHTQLFPNHALRSLIEDWRNNIFTSVSLQL